MIVVELLLLSLWTILNQSGHISSADPVKFSSTDGENSPGSTFRPPDLLAVSSQTAALLPKLLPGYKLSSADGLERRK